MSPQTIITVSLLAAQVAVVEEMNELVNDSSYNIKEAKFLFALLALQK